MVLIKIPKARRLEFDSTCVSEPTRILNVQHRLNTQENSKEIFQEPFKEAQLKLQQHYIDFVKTHNIKTSKSSVLAKVQKKILSE